MKTIKYTNPNFISCWTNAQIYPELKQMGKEKWIEFAKMGYSEEYKEIETFITNTIKQNNPYKNSAEEGKLEMPVAVKFADNEYHMISGCQILSAVNKITTNIPIWIIDLSNCMYAI